MANNFAFNTRGSRASDLVSGAISGLFGAKPKNKTVATPVTSSTQKPFISPSSSNPGAITQGTNPGILQTSKPSTPVKKITDTQGNTVEFHQENKPTTQTKKTELKPTTPQVGTPVQNAQTVLNTGLETPRETSSFQNLQQAGQTTPLEQGYIDRVVEAQKMQNAGRLGQYADASLYANKSPEELYRGLITAPDLAARGVGNAGLYNTFGDIYGSSATQGLLAANTIAGRGLSAAQSGLSGAQAQAGRAQSGAGTVFTSGLLGTVAPGQVPFSPLTGEAGNLTGTEGGGLFQAGAIQGQQALGQQYPALISAHTQAQGIQNQITNYLQQNPALNPSTVTDVNKVAQWLLGGKLGDPKYQTLANYLQEYVNTLAPILGVGGDVTNLKTEIAQSFVNGAANGQSISEVLENIDNLAATKLNAMKQTGTGQLTPTVSTSTQSGGSTFAEQW
jgi:hypothetical protein